MFKRIGSAVYLSLILAIAGGLVGCYPDETVTNPQYHLDSSRSYLPDLEGFTRYYIAKGYHECNPRYLQYLSLSELRFQVCFDSSAIYTTVDPENQADINKLYGFGDNKAAHNSYSARFGWRWEGNALALFAYVYNQGSFEFKKIGNVAIAQIHKCRIQMQGASYVFTLNDSIQVTMPRKAKTINGEGYRLYPYFGGNEKAPHDVKIWIK